MLNTRTVVLSVVLALILTGAIYFAVMASPAASASSTVTSCPVIHASNLSTVALKEILNGRYERRVGLPY